MDNPIKYSDLISPDGSIEKAIQQLTQLNEGYNKMYSDIQKRAEDLQKTLEKLSGATEEPRKQIPKVVNEVDKLAKAQKDLDFALSDTAKELAYLKEQQREQANLNKIMARLNSAMEGSYDKLSAQYSLNKMRINKLSQEYLENTKSGQALVKQTAEIYARMKQLQEATGKYTLNVGNYKSSWDGLGVSAAQLVRELPSLAVSANTFFLAISNNIPMLVDEINKLKAANAAAAAEGKATVPIWKSVGKAFLSYNTAMSIGITLLTVYGKDLFTYVGSLIKGKSAMDSFKKSTEQVNDALSKGVSESQKDIVKLKLIYETTQDVTKSTELRKEAVQDLKREYPDYFENMSNEAILAGEASEKYLELTDSLIKAAKARAIQDQLTQNAERRLELEKQVTEALNKQEKAEMALEKAKAQGSSMTVAGGGVGLTSQLGGSQYQQALQKEVDNFSEAAKNARRELYELQKADKELTKQIDVSSLFGTKKGNGKTKKQKEEKDNTLQYVREEESARLDIMEEGMQKEIEMSNSKYRQEIEDLKTTLEKEKNLTNEAREAIQKTIAEKTIKMAQEEESIRKKYADKAAKEQQKQIEERNKLTEKSVEDEYNLRLSEIDLMKITENEKTKLKLQAEKERLKKLLQLVESGQKQMGDKEVQILKNTIEKIDNEIAQTGIKDQNRDIYDLIGLKLNDEQKQAISESVNFSISQLQSFLSAQTEAKNAMLENAQEEVDAAQTRLDQEIEARNNGYANDVATAQKELELAKKKEQQALKDKQAAQRQQQALDALAQSSSLITASANIWKSMSGLGPFGVAAAIAAIATMWTSFAAAKIKAQQVTKLEYGEGGIEFLEGGSHQSGNDIDMGTTPDGRKRRAEGGEAFAIINKKSTRKYRKKLSQIIKSINNGTFESKYESAFMTNGNDMILLGNNNVDLSKIEGDLSAIKKQNEQQIYMAANGTILKIKKNVKQIIK